jgi:hypothetical protein
MRQPDFDLDILAMVVPFYFIFPFPFFLCLFHCHANIVGNSLYGHQRGTIEAN